VLHSDAGTFHVAAAAATSIWRPTAPARRSGSQFIDVAVDPPATCTPYFAWSAIACSMTTALHWTSSSSATSIGSIVLTPCPTSGFFAMIVTTPSLPMRMNAFGVKASASPGASSASRARPGTSVASRTPPPAMALTRRKSRRVAVIRHPCCERRTSREASPPA
jgi:hypothetical protein